MALVIDVTNPGRVYANAVNAKELQFLLVADKEQFTKEAFEQNPDAASGRDLYFKSDPVPPEKGQGVLDLSGKKDELKGKVTAAETPARLVIISTPVDGSSDDKKKASVQAVKLVKPASITLHDIRATASPEHWVAYHHAIIHVGLEVKGVEKIDIKWGPIGGPEAMFSMWEAETRGQARAKAMVFGAVGDPHAPSPKCPHGPEHHRAGWWGDSDRAPWRGKVHWGQYANEVPVAQDKYYVIGIYPRGTGSAVLEVKGSGAQGDVKARINIGMGGPHPHPGD